MRVLVMSALALVITITTPVILSARPASADEVSDLRTQAQQISQQILKDQLTIGGLEQQDEAATEHVQALDAAVSRTRSSLNVDHHKIDSDRQRLRRAAIGEYIDSGQTTADSASEVFGSNVQSDEARAEYEGIAAGDTTVSLDELHADQTTLRHEEAKLHEQHQQAQQAQQQAANLVAQSQAEQNELQNEQSQVKGQLAVAIQQEQAAREAAAQAAIEAAEQQAAAQAAAAQREQVQQAAAPAPAPTSTTETTVGATPSPSTSTTTTTANPPMAVAAAPTDGSTPALNSFLQCVLQAESSGNYGAISPSGEYMGAFQFSQSTWNEAAQLAGMPQLIGMAPNTATPAEQDALAIALYNADGESPWYDPCTE
jgi:peptidoglycan hydrolase CwlO-like protein